MSDPTRALVVATVLGGVLFLAPSGPLAAIVLVLAWVALGWGLFAGRPARWSVRALYGVLAIFLGAWAYSFVDDVRLARGGVEAAERLETAKRSRIAARLSDRLSDDRALSVRVAGALDAELDARGPTMIQDPDLFVALGRAAPPELAPGIGLEIYDATGSLRAWWGDPRGGRMPADSVAGALGDGLIRRPPGYVLAYAGVPWVTGADSFTVVVKDLWVVETPLRRDLGETGLILPAIERSENLSIEIVPASVATEAPVRAAISGPTASPIAWVVAEDFVLGRYLADRHRDFRRLFAALYLLPFMWIVGFAWQAVRTRARRRSLGAREWLIGSISQIVVLAGVWLFLIRSRLVALLLPDEWFSPLSFASDALGPGTRSPGDFVVTASFAFVAVVAAYAWIPSERARPSRLWAVPALVVAALVTMRASPAVATSIESALQSMDPALFFSPTLLFSPPHLMVLLGFGLLVATAAGGVALAARWLDLPTDPVWTGGIVVATAGALLAVALELPDRSLAGRLGPLAPLLAAAFVGAGVLADRVGRRRVGGSGESATVRFALVAVGLSCLVTYPLVGFARVQAANDLLVERAERIGAASTQWLQYTMTRTIEYLATTPEVKRALVENNEDAALLLWNESPLRALDFASALYLVDDSGAIVSQFALVATDLSGRARRFAADAVTPAIEIEGPREEQGIWWAIVPIVETVEPAGADTSGTVGEVSPPSSRRIGAAVAMTTGALELREPTAGSAFFLTDLLAGSGRPSSAPSIATLGPGETPSPRTLTTSVERAGGEPVRLAMPLEPLLPGPRETAVFAFLGVIAGVLLGFFERVGDAEARRRWRMMLSAENPLRSFRLQLLLAFVLVAAIPLTLYGVLGYRASRAELQEATRAAAADALSAATRLIADDPALERGTPRGLTRRLGEIAAILQQDLVLYWRGRTVASSRPEIFASRLFADRMPGEVYAELFALRSPIVFDATALGGRSFLVAYQPFGEAEAGDGYVLATPLLIREDRARLDVQRLGEGVFLLSVFSIGFLLIVSGWLSRYLTEPLFALERGTRQIAAGRLSFRLPAPERRDEVGRLQQAFNAMAERLDTGQRALEREKSRVQAILASVGAGVVALDERGIVRLINERAEALLGERSDEVIDRSVRDLSDMERRTADFWSAVRAYHDRSRTRDRDLVLPADGRQRHFHIVAAPLRDGAGRERGLVVAFEDITDNVQSQRVLAWGEMARQVAHEIKNPLTPMKLSLQHLERTIEDGADDLEEILRRNIDLVLAEIERLERIAGNFARFAVPDPAISGPFDAQTVAREVVGLFAPGDSDIEYELEIVGGPTPLRGDAEGFRRILVNLLQNSREAIIVNGSGKVVVRLDWTRESGWARVSVIDDGVGLPAEGVERLFEPSFSTKTRGTGLGLAITRRIVEAWGGTISYERVADGGTAIHFRVPVVEGATDVG